MSNAALMHGQKADGSHLPIVINNFSEIIATQATNEWTVPGDLVWQYLTTNNLPDGPKNLAIDGSVTPIEFYYQPPDGYDFGLSRIVLYLESSMNFDSAKFMHLPALENGIGIKIGNKPKFNIWKKNLDLVMLMYNIGNLGTAFSKQTRSLAAEFRLDGITRGNRPVLIANGERISFTVEDAINGAGNMLFVFIEGELRAV